MWGKNIYIYRSVVTAPARSHCEENTRGLKLSRNLRKKKKRFFLSTLALSYWGKPYECEMCSKGFTHDE